MIKEDVFIESPYIVEYENYENYEDYETERNKPMPSFNHSQIELNIGAALRYKYKKQFTIVVEVDLDLPNAERPTVPDLAIFPKTKLRLSKDVIKVKEPPITTIEILSPKQKIDDIKEKIFESYFPAGVKSAWLIIPDARTVTIYSPDATFVSYSSGKFTDPATGISITLDEVFEDLD